MNKKSILVLVVLLSMVTSSNAEIIGSFSVYVDITSVTVPALDKLFDITTSENYVYMDDISFYFVPVDRECVPAHYGGAIDEKHTGSPLKRISWNDHTVLWTYNLDKKTEFPRKVCMRLVSYVGDESGPYCNLFAQKRAAGGPYPYGLSFNSGQSSRYLRQNPYCVSGWITYLDEATRTTPVGYQLTAGLESPDLFYYLGVADPNAT